MRLIDADKLMKAMYHRAFETDGDTMWQSGCWVRYRAIEQVVKEQPTVKTEPQWIPCSERLPEEDVEVLITYRYKEGEGDTSHAYMDITTYGQMYFGGNKVGKYKHWRQPFEYFESNYEVVAWMPLPEPYREGEQDENR